MAPMCTDIQNIITDYTNSAEHYEKFNMVLNELKIISYDIIEYQITDEEIIDRNIGYRILDSIWLMEHQEELDASDDRFNTDEDYSDYGEDWNGY